MLQNSNVQQSKVEIKYVEIIAHFAEKRSICGGGEKSSAHNLYSFSNGGIFVICHPLRPRWCQFVDNWIYCVRFTLTGPTNSIRGNFKCEQTYFAEIAFTFQATRNLLPDDPSQLFSRVQKSGFPLATASFCCWYFLRNFFHSRVKIPVNCCLPNMKLLAWHK